MLLPLMLILLLLTLMLLPVDNIVASVVFLSTFLADHSCLPFSKPVSLLTPHSPWNHTQPAEMMSTLSAGHVHATIILLDRCLKHEAIVQTFIGEGVCL